MDLVTANDLSVSVLEGNGDGTFQPEQRFWRPAVQVLEDFNGDRQPNGLAASGSNNAIWIFLHR